MGSTFAGIGAVYKGVIVVSIGVGMRKSKLKSAVFVIDGGIQIVPIKFTLKEILQSFRGVKAVLLVVYF